MEYLAIHNDPLIDDQVEYLILTLITNESGQTMGKSPSTYLIKMVINCKSFIPGNIGSLKKKCWRHGSALQAVRNNKNIPSRPTGENPSITPDASTNRCTRISAQFVANFYSLSQHFYQIFSFCLTPVSLLSWLYCAQLSLPSWLALTLHGLQFGCVSSVASGSGLPEAKYRIT